MNKLLGVAALLVALTAFAVAAAAADTGGTDRPFTGTLAGSALGGVPDLSCPFPLESGRTRRPRASRAISASSA